MSHSTKYTSYFGHHSCSALALAAISMMAAVTPPRTVMLLPLLLVLASGGPPDFAINQLCAGTQPVEPRAKTDDTQLLPSATALVLAQPLPFPAQPYELFWTLGDAHDWAPTPYNMSQYGFTSGNCGATLPPGNGPGSFCYGNTWTRDLGASQRLGFPSLFLTDRGADGKPCAGEHNGAFRGPCYNHSWAPTCAYTKVDTGTEYGAMCTCTNPHCTVPYTSMYSLYILVYIVVSTHVLIRTNPCRLPPWRLRAPGRQCD